jgi:hypothetical protein
MELVNLLAFMAKWFNFDEYKPGGLNDMYAVASWNFGTIS